LKSVGEEFQKKIIQTARLLDQKLYHKIIPSSSFFKPLFSLFLNGIGWALAFIFLKRCSVPLANGVTKRIIRSRFKGEVPPLSPASLENIAWAKTIRETYIKDGKKVLILILISHPKTTPEEAPMIGKIMWSASEAATSIAPNSKFKILQAIDPFALDSLSFPIASLYAAFMAQGHIALDRQPFERTVLARFIFKKFHYSSIFFRILNSIKQGDLFCMALAGGVAHNARILYTVKEFAHRIYFLGLKNKISKHHLEMNLIKILTQETGCAPITGVLSSKEVQELKTYLIQMGIVLDKTESLVKDLEEELFLETPYRFRFFRALLARLCRNGNALLILPLKHKGEGAVEVGKPVLMSEYEKESEQIIKSFVRQTLNR